MLDNYWWIEMLLCLQVIECSMALNNFLILFEIKRGREEQAEKLIEVVAWMHGDQREQFSMSIWTNMKTNYYYQLKLQNIKNFK